MTSTLGDLRTQISFPSSKEGSFSNQKIKQQEILEENNLIQRHHLLYVGMKSTRGSYQ